MAPINIVSALILTAGVFFDLKTRKINNRLILFCIPIALLAVALLEGPRAVLWMSLPAGLTALSLGLALFYLNIIGGGDVKLFFALSLTLSPAGAFWSLFYAFPIGLVLGLLRIIFQGKFKNFLHNMAALLQRVRPDKSKLQTFPFSAALLLGWMTFKVLE